MAKVALKAEIDPELTFGVNWPLPFGTGPAVHFQKRGEA